MSGLNFILKQIRPKLVLHGKKIFKFKIGTRVLEHPVCIIKSASTKLNLPTNCPHSTLSIPNHRSLLLTNYSHRLEIQAMEKFLARYQDTCFVARSVKFHLDLRVRKQFTLSQNTLIK